MPRCGLGRVRAAIQRLDPHAPHHRGHPLAADRDAFAAQQVAQHPAAGERVVQVQRVDPPHDRQVGRRHRPRFVVEAAAAQPQQRRLPRQLQSVAAVDHRFALSRPALLSAPDKKSFSSVSPPILACRTLRSTAAAAGLPAGPEPNTSGGTLRELGLPGRDLVRMHVILLRQLGQRLLALEAANATLALKAGQCVRRARLSWSLPIRAILAVPIRISQPITSNLPGHLCHSLFS